MNERTNEQTNKQTKDDFSRPFLTVDSSGFWVEFTGSTRGAGVGLRFGARK
jgi:hypothetical protein